MPSLPPSGSLNRPQLLIVDDDPAVLDVTRSMARAIGCHALVADTAQQALDHFRECADRIHTLLVDLNMPRLDGLAFIRLVREYRPSARVLLMTGDVVEPGRLAEAGVPPECVLVKPFSLDHLRDAVFGDSGESRAA